VSLAWLRQRNRVSRWPAKTSGGTISVLLPLFTSVGVLVTVP
jgi:hypothetical protein